MEDLRIKNQLLTRANVKHVTKIRSLENQIKKLQNELLFERTNRLPLGHIQDVCCAAIEEFDSLQEQIKIKSDKWNKHARIGLQAIIDLIQPSKTRQLDKIVESAKKCEAGHDARQLVKIKKSFPKGNAPLARIDENRLHPIDVDNSFSYLRLNE